MSASSFTESWYSDPQANKFYTRTYTAPGPSKAVIVFVHGFAEHVGRYAHFHPLFLQHGISVFAFDQRGFGMTALDEHNKSKASSYGKTCWKDQMNDIAWALQHVNQEFPGIPTFLMGHSMVGTLIHLQSLFLRVTLDYTGRSRGIRLCHPRRGITSLCGNHNFRRCYLHKSPDKTGSTCSKATSLDWG